MRSQDDFLSCCTPAMRSQDDFLSRCTPAMTSQDDFLSRCTPAMIIFIIKINEKTYISNPPPCPRCHDGMG